MEPVATAESEVVVSFVYEKLAQVASLVLDHPSLIDRVVLCFDLEVHLVDIRCSVWLWLYLLLLFNFMRLHFQGSSL